MIRVLDPVATALREGRPVVALESTLIAHGLPWPQNLEVGRALEDAVRAAGAEPATIAVFDGIVRVGLPAELLQRLAKEGTSLPKTGTADLAVRIARSQSGATTVSGTLAVCARVGIEVFATGGIGGVHRGATDVSSDLASLSRVPVCVVSAGPKAILDLPRTLEALETLGVLVVGYGTNELPAFYTRQSGVGLEHRVDGPDEAAAVIATRFTLAQGGVLLCNPIPVEAALDGATVEAAIASALQAADARRIRGKALTPFLLSELGRLTGGASVAANRALAIENARVAAEVAGALVTRRLSQG